MENEQSATMDTVELGKYWGVSPKKAKEIADANHIRKLPGIEKDLWFREDIVKMGKSPETTEVTPVATANTTANTQIIKDLEDKIAELKRQYDIDLTKIKANADADNKRTLEHQQALEEQLKADYKDKQARIDALIVSAEVKDKEATGRNEQSLKQEDDLKKREEILAVDMAKNKADAETNAKLKKEYEAGLREIDEGKIKIEHVFSDAQGQAKEALSAFKQHVSGKSLARIEKASILLTTGIVERAYLEYSCEDCHKETAKSPSRLAHFNIPMLKECSPNFAFGTCQDCEQKDSRQLPLYICEICPMGNRMEAAWNDLKIALELAGIKIEYDTDGVYLPKYYEDGNVKDKSQTSPKEWVKRILADTKLSNSDVEEMQKQALAKLTQPDLEPEPTLAQGIETGSDKNNEGSKDDEINI